MNAVRKIQLTDWDTNWGNCPRGFLKSPSLSSEDQSETELVRGAVPPRAGPIKGGSGLRRLRCSGTEDLFWITDCFYPELFGSALWTRTWFWTEWITLWTSA